MSTLHPEVATTPKSSHRRGSKDAEQLDAKFADAKKIQKRRHAVVSQSFAEMMRARGLKDLLVTSSWKWLGFYLLCSYGLGGLVAGICLSLAGEKGAGLWDCWYRGTFLLLVQVEFDPVYAGEKLCAVLFSIVGAVCSLLMFGIIYEKFAEKKDAFAFSDRICLRRLPPDLGGHTMMTIRYANLKGHSINGVDTRLCIIKRFTDEAGEGIIRTMTMSWDGDGMVGLPPAFFITHTIDSNSPLYDSSKPPWNCNFSGIIRIFISVQGLDHESQEHVTGSADWGTAMVVPDFKFCEAYKSVSAANGTVFDVNLFNDIERIKEKATFSKDEKEQAKREDFGLPKG
ncbi:hypothetical protein TrST_g1042 [Triparma strigata]|uniref:Uncharacterized protein n=1 Tax=Triparma strigata TaxID=1606541 RepID=A0A9W7E493_9STRA|nr:hypothetical protein TrST_g1042 [Triparma strigata]